jgi:hypothetical protein
MKKIWFFCSVLILMFALNSSAKTTKDIGFIKKLKGSASIIREKSDIPAKAGNAVFMGDIIQTGALASVGVTFKDNSRISIGPDTTFIIDEYIYQPKKKAMSFVSSLQKGTLHFISGNMAKLSPKSISVKTPEGTIGIRGTRFVIKVEPN